MKIETWSLSDKWTHRLVFFSEISTDRDVKRAVLMIVLVTQLELTAHWGPLGSHLTERQFMRTHNYQTDKMWQHFVIH